MDLHRFLRCKAQKSSQAGSGTEVKPTTSMRCEWIITSTCVLMGMGLSIICLNQCQLMETLNESHMKVSVLLQTVNSAYKYDEAFKTKLEGLVTKGMTKLNTLNNEVAQMNSDLKTKAETCQAEKEKNQHEIQEAELELNNIMETSKAKSDTWNSEKKKLDAELTGRSMICNYVKKDTIVLRLCMTPSNNIDKQ